MTQNDGIHSATPGRGPGYPFIPAKLDDGGLSLAEFRFVCHVARRSVCTASLPKMAKVCRMNKKTLQAAIKRTVALGIVNKLSELGKTLTLTIAHPHKWKLPSPNGALAQSDTQGLERVTTKPNPSPTHLAQTEPYKGNPSEGNPSKGGPRPLEKEPDWKLRKDRRELETVIREEKEKACGPDEEILAGYRDTLRKIKDEQRVRGRESKQRNLTSQTT